MVCVESAEDLATLLQRGKVVPARLSCCTQRQQVRLPQASQPPPRLVT